MLQGFAILLAFHMLGLLLADGLSIPLPIGLVLFVIALFAGWIKLEWVEESAQFLLKHMMLFFAPYIVGTIVYLRVIGENGLGIGLSLIGSTLLVLAVTGKVTEWLGRKEKLQDERDGLVE